MDEQNLRSISHVMRGIPFFLLKEYLVELGGSLQGRSTVVGEGWKVRMKKMEPFRIGSLSVGQTLLNFELEEAIADVFLERFQKKTLRAGG